ncbi:MAG: DegT/DnrJ/EryC1/StrS family aminotransferase [Planctomycetota bacterium]
MPETLAIHGGPKTIPDGTIKPWPPIGDGDREMVLASLEGDSHAFGPNCKAFQHEFAEWNGNRYAITTNSGTAALHMCVAACGCGAGDEVIVTAYSWSSSATCVLHHNAIPVFVDIDWETMNMDVDRIEDAVTERTKAIIAVHIHGLPVDMDAVNAIAEEHDLTVIEDACQAHGATFGGKKTGTLGDCAAFSFNQNKCLCGGEGGMFVTDDETLFDAAKQLWSFGETRTPLEDRDYHAYALGWMYRNSDLNAAFARAQLRRLDDYLERTKQNAARLAHGLADVPHLVLPTEPEGHGHNWYNYTVRFDVDALGGSDDPAGCRDRIVTALKAEGVPTALWQKYPLPAMTVFQAKNGYGRGCPWECPHAEPVDYSLDRFPVARRHADRHASVSVPLRPPNRPEVADLTADAFQKVMTQVEPFG